ncbi:MAG: UDP-3-O-(3-hydroxymyristoyl)glucosamine N-acyltransferase [Alphaproteobacteria bacterium]|nr:UDP-3-O-(3-hydroxymyristoyl)glucosamine N-acyltransferase [Alphaproteobacteria bacterium]
MAKNLRFFFKKEFLTLQQVLEITQSKPHKEINILTKIFDIKSLESASEFDISFLNSGQYHDKFLSSKAGFCFVEEKNINKIPSKMVGLICQNPYFRYAQIVNEFYQEKTLEYSSSKLIDPSAKIGKNCQIAPNVFIGKDVEIGDNCIIGPNSSIIDGVIIGNNCKINSGVVISFATIGNNCEFFNGAKIGQDGFGFVHNAGKNYKIKQIGIVEIADNVEIGANTCIDRGALENTIINSDVKIDNLCQIAHNVEIGQGTVIAGSTAVAGSCKIGKFVQIGGNCSIGGHIRVGDGAKIAGMSGVMRDVEPKSAIAGIPVLPIKKWHRLNIELQKLIDKKR